MEPLPASWTHVPVAGGSGTSVLTAPLILPPPSMQMANTFVPVLIWRPIPFTS